MLNLDFVPDIQVIRECTDKPTEPTSLNIERLNARAKEQIEKKTELVMAMKAGVSPEEQGLFTDEEHWSGDDEDDPGELFEAITAVPTTYDRQGDGVHDDQDQRLTLPTHETTNIVNTACPIQKAVEEYSLVNDYMGEEGGKECHGSLKTYDIEISKGREMQPTHHKESSVFDEAYQGDVSKLFDKTYKGNMFKLAVKDGKDNALNVDVPRAVATYKPDDYGPEYSNTNCVKSRGSGTRARARGTT